MAQLRELKCPHCQTLIETNKRVGLSIECPECSQPFSIEPAVFTRRGSEQNSGAYKILVPLGYVAFVAIPLACSVYFLMKKTEKPPEIETAAAPETKETPKTDHADHKAKTTQEKARTKGKPTGSTHSEDSEPSTSVKSSTVGSSGGTPTTKEPEHDSVFRTPEELFARMPEDSRPKSGPDGGIERAAAKKWANANLAGRTIEWTALVGSVEVQGEDPFTITARLSPREGFDNQNYSGATPSLPFGNAFSLGDQVCLVRIAGDQHKIADTVALERNTVRFDACNLERAKQLRTIAGRLIVLNFQIAKVSIESESENGKRLVFSLQAQPSKTIVFKAAPSGPVAIIPPTKKPNDSGSTTESPTEIKKPAVPTETVAATPSVAVAPLPREAPWKGPETGFVTDWQKLGSIDLRVASLGIAKVPVNDGKGNVTESKNPLLVVVVELRKNTPGKNRFLYSWQRYLDNKITGTSIFSLTLPDGKELAPGRLSGGKLNAGLPEKQLLPDDGTPIRDVVLFAAPPEDAGALTLHLIGERCGEAGEFTIEIPRGAWVKK